MTTYQSPINLPTFDDNNTRRMVSAIRGLAEGRSLAVGEVTLAANAATTSVSFQNCSQNAQIFLSPRTANAAAEVGAGTIYVSSVSNGSFVLTHANNAQTDRTFGFAVFG
jgi:membrane-associated phospholipid phosphatase